MHSTQFKGDEERENGGEKRTEREKGLVARKERSSLPGSIEAVEKGVSETRHVLAGVKSIPVKERKTRENRALVSRSVIISIWVDRSIVAKGTERLGRRERQKERTDRYGIMGRVLNHSFLRRTTEPITISR